jgi:hypothetical protein
MKKIWTIDEILGVVLKEISANGQRWRNDWSDFDGRQLRHELNDITEWATKAKMGIEIEEYTENRERLKNQSEGL